MDEKATLYAIVKEKPIRTGGLYRCCIESINESKVPNAEGEVDTCKFCGAPLRFEQGAWEWNQHQGRQPT